MPQSSGFGVESCGEICSESSTDDLVGFTLALNDAIKLCFCYYDLNALLPAEGTSGFFASRGAGEGEVNGSDGREDHVCYKYTPPMVSQLLMIQIQTKNENSQLSNLSAIHFTNF